MHQKLPQRIAAEQTANQTALCDNPHDESHSKYEQRQLYGTSYQQKFQYKTSSSLHKTHHDTDTHIQYTLNWHEPMKNVP
jgi:hypothetical protein